MIDKQKKPSRNLSEPSLKEESEYSKALLKVLSDPAVASKAKCFDHYDKNVMGNSIIESGQADAGLIKAVDNSNYGIALSVDNNPKYGRISPYYGAANAVAEAMRNVAAVGAIPSALTDCLNFGNPEKPEQFYDFKEAVKGIKDAAEQINYYKTNHPVPIISGNVSFYNESKSGKQVDPSPVIACVGVMKDYTKAIDMKLKQVGSTLILIGDRKNELGGSAYYNTKNELGENVPKIDFKEQKGMIYAVIDAIDKELLLSCHDISDGGMAACLAEMILGGSADGTIGAEIEIDTKTLRNDAILFSETPGFIFEIKPEDISKVRKIFQGIPIHEIGTTVDKQKLTITNDNKKIIDLTIDQMKESWTTGFTKALQ